MWMMTTINRVEKYIQDKRDNLFIDARFELDIYKDDNKNTLSLRHIYTNHDGSVLYSDLVLYEWYKKDELDKLLEDKKEVVNLLKKTYKNTPVNEGGRNG